MNPFRSRLRRRQSGRRSLQSGLSLLEVMLAIAILGMALAIIGELVRLGTRSARDARDSATAQLLCESRMAEIASGIQSSDPVQLTPFQEFPDWLYAIESEPCQQEGLLYVRVTVQADQPAQKYPLTFSLSRWIVDPAKELDANSQSAATTGSGSASGTASSGASSSGGSKP